MSTALCLLLSTGSAQAQCVGDCSGTGVVRINDLILGVNIASDSAPISACPSFDCQNNGTVPINCLIQGVNNASNGCPVVNTPTVTETPTSAETPTATPTNTMPSGTPGLCQLKPGVCMGGPNAGNDCTATSQCLPGGTCNLAGAISKIELNVAGIPAPLAFALSGELEFRRGAITDGEASMECIINNIDPVNIPGIGFVCITPATEPCTPLGKIDCDGSEQLLGIDVLGDGQIGACQSNAACEAQCDTYCATVGGVRQTAGCTGHCSGATPQVCTNDEQCLGPPANGACNGPDPVGGVADICQCQCINTAAGAAARQGDFQCQLGSSLVVESGSPCNGTDVIIQVGDACIPVTTATASSLITNANFIMCPSTDPPCTVPITGQAINNGSPVACPQFEVGGSLSGLQGVGAVNFFGSALGDIATELFSVCK